MVTHRARRSFVSVCLLFPCVPRIAGYLASVSMYIRYSWPLSCCVGELSHSYVKLPRCAQRVSVLLGRDFGDGLNIRKSQW